MSTLKNHIAHFWAFNNSSVENAKSILYYLVFMFYLLLIVVSTSDAMILIPSSQVMLPVLNIPLPLWEFYLCMPLLVVILHFNLLYNLIQHSKKAYAYQQVEKDADHLTTYPFIVNFVITSQKTNNFWWLRFVLWLLIFAFPLGLLCAIQWQFSAYHSSTMTLWHCFVVMLDALVLSFAWHKIFHPSLTTKTTASNSNDVTKPSVKAKKAFQDVKLSWQVAVFVVFALFNLTVLLIFKSTNGQSVQHLMPHLKVQHQTLIKAPPSDQIIQRFIALGKSKEEAYCEYARGLDLRGRDLRFCDFSGAYLVNANLEKADIRGANFSSANLHGSNLTKSIVLGAVFFKTKMHYTKLHKIAFRKTLHKALDLRHAQLSALDLSNLNLKNYIFKGAVCTNVDFKSADLSDVEFTGAVFKHCFMKGVQMQRAVLNGVTFEQANKMDGARMQNAQMKAAYLNGVSLQGADMSNVALEGAMWQRDSIQGVNLRNAHLQGAVIEAQVFSGNCLVQARIKGSILSKIKGSTHNYYYAVNRDQKPYWRPLHKQLKKYNVSRHLELHTRGVKDIIEERIALAKQRLSKSDTTDIQEYFGTNNGDNFVQERKKIACQNIYIAEGVLSQTPLTSIEENERIYQQLSDYLRNNCARIYEKIVKRGKVKIN
ncbi:pentapeptide repeat-containing protein [Microscilla marina]|uniref:Pentapeptide repeat-containing protein n=1 Tax=Microscilla marina ATCC 23134 TaxID=313606 RepID=A1ZP16_MICM2|nr:pentapeptide repeat-containing protein [Microscilla marina]EAY27808.1 hypothetical protein M23134_00249 [Microscilla marina ATCC 23134]